MGVKTKSWDFYGQYLSTEKNKFEGIDFKKLFEEMDEAGVVTYRLLVQKIEDWPRGPMRNFFHGVVIPAFQIKLNETYSGNTTAYWTAERTKEVIKRAILGGTDCFSIPSTEGLTAEEYWEFLNACELLYFNKFHETYDTRKKPLYIRIKS